MDEQSDRQRFEEWLATRPKSVQVLGHKYPPGWYRIKPGAPYGISTPGTVVRLYAYSEDGDVGVVVFADRKRPEALEFERLLWQEHGKEGDPPHDQNILVHIDPQWMEPCDGNDA